MKEIWAQFDNDQISQLMDYFQATIKKNKEKKREFTSLQKLCFELRNEMMLRESERKQEAMVTLPENPRFVKPVSKVTTHRKKDWREGVKNVGGND